MRTALIILIALLASCATPPLPTPEASPPPKTVAEAIQQATAGLVARKDPAIPSLVVGVWRGGAQEFHTYGDRRATPSSLVRVASMTKPLSALLVATYVADGTLSYDTPVGVGSCTEREVSAFCFRGAATTFQHLVQHTSGLPQEPDNMGPDYSAASLQDFVARYQLSIEPGKRFRYSTAGYAALGMALARRTHVPFARTLAERVIDPLGLTATTFTPTGALLPGFDHDAVAPDSPRPEALWPSGGLASTPQDLLRLATINLHPDEVPALADAIRLTQRVTSEITAFDTSQTALGWFYFEPLEVYWHGGSTTGYDVFTAFSPGTDTAIVLVANTTLPHDGRLAAAGFDLFGKLASIP